MTVRVGIIGTGLIGTDHGQKLARRIAGATVSAVTDVNRARAEEVAADLGAAVIDSAASLIASPDVDAVLIASVGPTHAEYVLACLAAGKHVLCEKPLATTVEDCLRILEAESALGRRRVVVGFMRRVDAGYEQVKAGLDAGAIGEALMVHNVHRNPTVGEAYTSFMTMTDSVIHEVDTIRWLVGEEIASIQVLPPRRSPRAFPHLQDPQFVAFTTESGILATVDFFANAQYGYDVRCEVVGSEGTASLVNPTLSTTVLAGMDTTEVAPDWRVRFGAAYHAELQAWIDGVARDEAVGPSSWDGYAATLVTERGVEAVRTPGQPVAVAYVEKPALYR
ncbi:MAG: Gfo/Idh/MocA family oxidoreductase [Candidatus Limnocylindrales bacterium]